MIRKYFPTDKNSILKKAQQDLKTELVGEVIRFCKKYYLMHHNPLGIEDSAVKKIKQDTTAYTERLDDFYFNLAAIYRFQFGKNQLELLFDGRSHYEKYSDDWRAMFKAWVLQFCGQPHFLRAVLELTVFYPRERKALLAENRMKAFMHHHFGLKVYKYKGIVKPLAS